MYFKVVTFFPAWCLPSRENFSVLVRIYKIYVSNEAFWLLRILGKTHPQVKLKRMNMCMNMCIRKNEIRTMGKLNQLFIKGSYIQIELKKMK